MSFAAPHEDDGSLVEEAEAVRRARSTRDHALSPGERLEHLHVLCANAAVIAQAAERGAA